MADISSQNRDNDNDGMPDVMNAKMPAVSFITAMIGLAPTLYAVRSSIAVFKDPSQRTIAFVMSFLAVAVATGAIVAAAYGSRAATRGLASGGRWIGISEVTVAILLIIILFFKNS